MRRLALTDDILMKIEKPARYIGNEVNSVMKDKADVDIRFAMCFPDVYEIIKKNVANLLWILVKSLDFSAFPKIYSNNKQSLIT